MKSFTLLKDRKFAPFFWTQFWGAFNDNYFKNALVILITFEAADQLHINASLLVTLSAGIFILPFFLFSATAGQIADYTEKSRLIRIVKICEILIMLLGCVGFYFHNIYFLLLVLFLMGFHSAIFGPVKYSIIPQILEENELMGGNAIVELGTFVAILAGTILGGTAIAVPDIGVYLAMAGVLLFAVLGFISCLFIKKIPPTKNTQKISWNVWTQTRKILAFTRENVRIQATTLAISWFWFIGVSYLALFPGFAKEFLGGDQHVVNLFLASFSIGIGIGSLISEKMSHGKIDERLIGWGSYGMAIAGTYLFFVSPKISMMAVADLANISTFVSQGNHLQILFALVLFSIAGGVFIVPLYALIQKISHPDHRSQIIAGNNVLNAFFMVIASVVNVILLKMHLPIPYILWLIALLNLPVPWILKKYGKLGVA